MKRSINVKKVTVLIALIITIILLVILVVITIKITKKMNKPDIRKKETDLLTSAYEEYTKPKETNNDFDNPLQLFLNSQNANAMVYDEENGWIVIFLDTKDAYHVDKDGNITKEDLNVQEK